MVQWSEAIGAKGAARRFLEDLEFESREEKFSISAVADFSLIVFIVYSVFLLLCLFENTTCFVFICIMLSDFIKYTICEYTYTLYLSISLSYFSVFLICHFFLIRLTIRVVALVPSFFFYSIFSFLFFLVCHLLQLFSSS